MNDLLSQILVKDAKLEAYKIDENDIDVINFVNDIYKKQDEILKLKIIDEKYLKLIINI